LGIAFIKKEGLKEKMMEKFLPILQSIKSYTFERDLTKRISNKKLVKYQDRAFRKTIKYASKVPIYKKKYEENNINLSEIKGIKDIHKLPIVTKQDLRNGFPKDIIPKNFKNGFLINTSGSNGRPLSIWSDLFTAIRCLQAFTEELADHDISWKKNKITIIGDFSSGSPEGAFLVDGFFSNFKIFFSMKNMQILDINEDVRSLMRKIGKFNPDFIGGYPPLLKALALLSDNGFDKKINPKFMASSGTKMDTKTRLLIEEKFGIKLFDVYSTAEAGTIAYQCKEGKYHVHSELVHLEILDKNGNVLPFEKRGDVVVTKLYGKGTPIVRYIGLNDTAKLSKEKCKCGRNTPIIKDIEGRTCDLLILPNGKIQSPFSLTGIPGTAMQKTGDFRIKKFQILQKEIDFVELLVVMNDIKSSSKDEKLFSEISKDFQNKLGKDVKFNIRKVKEFSDNGNHSLVVSNVKFGGGCNV
jgi:phenylacetate-CoA ligase